jgi:hypothetical protein
MEILVLITGQPPPLPWVPLDLPECYMHSILTGGAQPR